MSDAVGSTGGSEGGGADGAGLVDAERILALTERLRDAHARIDGASITGQRRSNYQRRLAAVADAGQSDLDKAEAQLERLEADLDRQLDR